MLLLFICALETIEPRSTPEAVSTKPAWLGTAKPWVFAALTGGLVGVVIGGGVVSWWWKSSLHPFHFKHSGAFGPETYAGGADKIGHVYALYAGTRATIQLYEWAGLSRTASIVSGAGFTFMLSTIVEIVDGFSIYGFEYADVIANLSGLGFALLTELLPAVDDLFGLRFNWIPSDKFIRGEKNYLRIVNDYSGMLFFFDFKPAGLQRWGVSVGPLRYLMLGVTYNVFDYSPHGEERRRNFGVYIGLNVEQILDAIFAPRVGRFANYVALPFTSIGHAYDLDGHAWRTNFGIAHRFEVR